MNKNDKVAFRYIALVALLGLGAATCASASEGPPPVLNPKTYTSESGGYALHVNPSDLHGRGPGEYRFEKDGRIVWTNKFDFTLWDARVAEHGLIAGYAYSHGWRGFSTNGHKAGMGDFSVVLLSDSGEILLRDRHARDHSRFHHMPPSPLVRAVHLRDERFYVHLWDPDMNRREPHTWIYDLSERKRSKSVLTADMVRNGLFSKEDVAPKSDRHSIEEEVPPPTVSNLELRLLGTFPLKRNGPRASSALHHVAGFDLDDQDRICVLSSEEGQPLRLLLLDQEGTLLGECDLQEKRESGTEIAGPAWTGGDTFVFSSSSTAIGGSARCWRVDFSTGASVELSEVLCPAIKALAGFADGSFVGLTYRRNKYNSTSGLFYFNAEGKQQWKLETNGFRGKPDELLSPEDVTIVEDKLIVVLDNIKHAMQFFDRSGRFQMVIDFDDIWPREPKYPTDFAALGTAGFILYDFNANPDVYLLDADGFIDKTFRLTGTGARPFRPRDAIRAASDGRYWTCDEDSIVRLSTNMVVDHVVGITPDEDILTHPGRIFVTLNDDVAIADRRTKALHIFDNTGSLKCIAKPMPEDLTSISLVEQLATSPEGALFVCYEHGGQEWVHFSADCERTDTVSLGLDRVTEEWIFQPTSSRRWVLGYKKVFLHDPTGGAANVISRRPDGNWLENVQSGAGGPDGSLAVLAAPLGLGRRGKISVNLYGADGEARSMFFPQELRERWVSHLAYDGRTVYLAQKDSILVYSSDGACAGKFKPKPEVENSSWSGPFSAVGGEEIWIVDTDNYCCYRYASYK